MKRKIVLSSLIWVTSMGLLTACGQGANMAEVEPVENVSDEVVIQEEETKEDATEAEQENEVEQESEVAEDLSQYAGYYSHSYSEEIEGEMLDFSETIQLNEDGSCEVTFQDTIEGTWTKEKIQLADGSKFAIHLQDNAIKLNRDNEWVTYEKVIGDKGVEDYPANEMEARVGKTSFASYDEIISLLDENEAYGYATIKGCDQEVLLVATEMFDYGDGTFAALEATAYTMKKDGTCTADNILVSGGTATPISIDEDGVIYCANHITLDKYCYGDNGTGTPAIMVLATITAEEFDDNGDPKKVSGFVRTENTLIDNDGTPIAEDDVALFAQMFDDFNNKTKVIPFKTAK